MGFLRGAVLLQGPLKASEDKLSCDHQTDNSINEPEGVHNGELCNTTLLHGENAKRILLTPLETEFIAQKRHQLPQFF